MQRFLVFNKNGKLVFDEKDIHHILSVLRKKIDDAILCIDQNNGLINAVIISINPFIAKISNISYVEHKQYDICAYIAVIKKNNFELIVEKLNELNIKSLTPVYFERSQKNISFNYLRFDRIIAESNKQCKRIEKMKVNSPITFNELTKLKINFKNTIFANEKEINNIKINDIKVNDNQEINFIIGPEGGFSNNEFEFLNSKCLSVKLTSTILKSETAAIYLASNIIERVK